MQSLGGTVRFNINLGFTLKWILIKLQKGASCWLEAFLHFHAPSKTHPENSNTQN
jgi:hypothetical protein